MNQPKIIQKRVGYSNSLLIVNGENSILVDTGVRGNFRMFRKMFREAGIQSNDIKLIILTHTHYDHSGNLHKLAEFTGAKVLVHKNEFENLKNGFTPIPKGQRYFMPFVTRLGRILLPKFASPKPFLANIINTGEYGLDEFGVDAKVISTPGHSEGSQSVLIGKTLISGDVFLNLRYGVIFPHFANEPEVLLRTWQKIYNLGVTEIYPGHGPRMKVEKTYPEFEKWKKKLNVEI